MNMEFKKEDFYRVNVNNIAAGQADSRVWSSVCTYIWKQIRDQAWNPIDQQLHVQILRRIHGL